ncbi:class I SAM-dependent methyltransferase [Pseudomarimonas arenosa]|uniref:Methyltransferase domain-containing protein n=1 Tax=Pseudomarimonas arenosa TaxID=2774145 RepID=A0AAW3ZKA0_9GAMM|nr:methyltransferase domain-containing protein [Pseudomarimonas arenosa]MBD8524891.1 methyltransferase domain-containing protein [Pseudomarimonas arenosa]
MSDCDFLDLGCSHGAMIEFVRSACPAVEGVGIDIDSKKVESARENGHTAMVLDIFRVPSTKFVSFVTMSHVLEHLPSVAAAESFIDKAVEIAHDFVFVRQPWFDADGPLFRLGLKHYWSHWRGHRNKMQCLDFYAILSRILSQGRLIRFDIYGRCVVRSSADGSILPLSAPIDQHAYDKELHGEKPVRPLGFETYREVIVTAQMSAHSGNLEALISRLGPLTLLYSEASE